MKKTYNFSSAVELSLRSHFVRYTCHIAKKYFYFLWRSVKLPPSIWSFFSSSESKDSNEESSEESDADRIPWLNNPRAWSTFSRYEEKLRGTMVTNFLARFRFPISRRETIFIFASNDWNCHKAVQAVRTNHRDGRRKGCTSNSGATGFITATWPEAIICRNTLLPKQFHKILNSLFDYLRHACRVYKMKGRTHDFKCALITYLAFVGIN